MSVPPSSDNACNALHSDVFHHVLLYAGAASVATFASCSKTCTLRVMRFVEHSTRVPWEVIWNVLLRSRFMVGRDVAQYRSRLKKRVRHPLSRTCRGCGALSYRSVIGFPVCEACSKIQSRVMHMVPHAHVMRAFPIARTWNLVTHRGRRTRLCFVRDVCTATGIGHYAVLIQLYSEFSQN